MIGKAFKWFGVGIACLWLLGSCGVGDFRLYYGPHKQECLK